MHQQRLLGHLDSERGTERGDEGDRYSAQRERGQLHDALAVTGPERGRVIRRYDSPG